MNPVKALQASVKDLGGNLLEYGAGGVGVAAGLTVYGKYLSPWVEKGIAALPLPAAVEKYAAPAAKMVTGALLAPVVAKAVKGGKGARYVAYFAFGVGAGLVGSGLAGLLTAGGVEIPGVNGLSAAEDVLMLEGADVLVESQRLHGADVLVEQGKMNGLENVGGGYYGHGM